MMNKTNFMAYMATQISGFREEQLCIRAPLIVLMISWVKSPLSLKKLPLCG